MKQYWRNSGAGRGGTADAWWIQQVQGGKLQLDEDVRVRGLHLLGATLDCS